MGKDIIYREDAIEALKGREDILHDAYTAVAIIRNIPSVDRPQGEWEDYDRYMKRCSKCGWIHDILHYGDDYCPHCGARMKGADDER